MNISKIDLYVTILCGHLKGGGFKPHELRYISHYFWMARQWLKERAAIKIDNLANSTTTLSSQAPPPCSTNDKNQTFLATRVAKPSQDEPLENDEASDAIASSGARLHPNISLSNRQFASLQERPPEFEKFLRELGITNDIGNYFS